MKLGLTVSELPREILVLGHFVSPVKIGLCMMNSKREHPPGTFFTLSNPCFLGGKILQKYAPPPGQKLGQNLNPEGKFFTFLNTVIVIRRPKEGLLIWSGVFCVGGKNMNFYVKKSNQVVAYRQI